MGRCQLLFTLGRSITGGLVPYRDIYEQKGPLLYFIHALAALISSKSFLGVYFIQAIICAIAHYYSIKIASVYTQVTGRLLILSVPLTMLLYSVNAYYYGDSAEEMLLLFFAITLYIVLKSIKEESLPSVSETAFIAIGTACAFWIKYTLCGFFLGVVIFYLVYSIRKKKLKNLQSSFSYSLSPLFSWQFRYLFTLLQTTHSATFSPLISITTFSSTRM